MTIRCEQEDFRQKGVDADQAGIGYISKECELHQSPVKQTVYRWIKFKNSGTVHRSVPLCSLQEQHAEQTGLR